MSYSLAHNTFSRPSSLSRDVDNLINMPPTSNQYREILERVRQEPNQYREFFERIRRDSYSDRYKELFERINREDLLNKHSLIPKIETLPPPDLNIQPLTLTISNDLIKTNWGEIIKIIDIDIPEDSIYRKLLACIPIIGIIPTVLNERSLREKIAKTKESTHFVKLINVKNHYKFASIVRKLLSIVLIVACVALPLLSWPIGIAAGVVGSGFIAFYAYGIHKNKQIIKTLQTNNLPAISQVY